MLWRAVQPHPQDHPSVSTLHIEMQGVCNVEKLEIHGPRYDATKNIPKAPLPVKQSVNTLYTMPQISRTSLEY